MAASSEPTILRFDGASTVDDVEAWLAAHKPTRRGYTEPWIYVHDRFTPPPTPDPTRNLDGRYRERAQAISERYMTAWETRRASGTISKAAGLALLATFLDDASALSREYDVRTGKWSIYVGVSEADEVWAKVVRAMALPGGPLRGLAHAAKTGARPGEDGYGGQCTVLCGVYVRDAFDLDNVKACLLGLIDATGREVGGFKLDTATAAKVKRVSGSGSQLLTSLYQPTRFISSADHKARALRARHILAGSTQAAAFGKLFGLAKPAPPSSSSRGRTAAEAIALDDSDEEAPAKRPRH